MIRPTAFDDPSMEPRKQQRGALFAALEAPPQTPRGPAPAVSPAAAPAFPQVSGAGRGTRAEQYGITPGAPQAFTGNARSYATGITPGPVGNAGGEAFPRPPGDSATGVMGSQAGPRQQQYGITPGAMSNVGSTPPPAGGTFQYDQARDDWMSGQYSKDEAGAAKWAAKWGVPYQGGDTITLPNGGGMIDILGNFKSGQNVAANWTPAGGNGLGGADGSGNAGGYGAPAGGAAGGGPGGDFNSQVRAMLMEQLGAMGKTPGAEDPIIKNQVDAYRREKERSGQNQRAALAERSAQSGLLQGGASSGAFDTGIAGIQEGIGEDVGQFAAGATAKELYNRRDQMKSLLAMALQTGDAETARALQLQIAQMDNQLRYATLSQQGRQFDANLGENRRQFDDQLGYNMGRASEDDQRWRLEYGF